MTRVVIACDKFKGTLTSGEVADAIGAGIVRAAPDTMVDSVLVADGGDGSLAVALAAGAREVPIDAADADGRVRNVSIAVGDGGPRVHRGPASPAEPTGAARAGARTDPVAAEAGARTDPVAAEAGARTDPVATRAVPPADTVATIEVASVCGLGARRPEPGQALRASSAGVGQAIRAALDLGVRRIVLAVGGTATSDGGAGMLTALGARLVGDDGHDVVAGALGLAGATRVDFSGLDRRLVDARIVVAADVDNPLLGAQGAAAVFAPQKGADGEAVRVIEGALARWAALASAGLAGAPASSARRLPREVSPDAPGAGAGGGLGYAAMLLGGSVRSGAAYFLDMAGLARRCVGADLVVTGEGRLDRQTLRGKAPAVVVRIAEDARVPCRAVVGRSDLSDAQARRAGFTAVDAIADLDPACGADAGLSRGLLGLVGERIGTQLAR